MDWRKGRRSDNVIEDDGGGGGGFGGGGGARFGGFHLGIGGIVVVVLVGLMFPSLRPILFGLFLGDGSNDVQQVAPSRAHAPSNPNDPQVQFVQSILGSTEDVWNAYFQSAGRQYEDPKLLLFHGATRSGCGAASESMGPFYCPNDQRVYLDLDFFHEMDTRFHASGDFARAYVIAHEVGHHVQNLLGVMRRIGRPSEGATGTSVRLELQADCFAGVWGNRSQSQLSWLEQGDVEAALNAASAVGDDTLQRQARGYAVPDSFTHGSAAQRMRWFKTGFASGDIASCDTFSAANL